MAPKNKWNEKGVNMKKNILMILIATFALGGMFGTGYAQVNINPISRITADETSSMNLQNDFSKKMFLDGNEKSFSYSFQPKIYSIREFCLSQIWKDREEIASNQTDSYMSISSVMNWKGLDNWTDQGLRKFGDWFVDTEWGYIGRQYSLVNERKIMVTPEFVSAALFLMGGLAFWSKKFFKVKP